MSSDPTRQLKVEVLPAPFTPSKEKHSPGFTPNEIPFTAIFPLFFFTSFSSSTPCSTSLSGLSDLMLVFNVSSWGFGSGFEYFLTKLWTCKVS